MALSNGLHGSVQMDSVALFSWIGWLRHHGILNHQIAMFEKAYKESKSKDRLYMWISNGWILDDVYVNKQASIFLMKEALKTKDATLIQYMYDRISLNKTPELEACALIYLKPTTSTIARWF